MGLGSIPLRIGNLINTQVSGGPYRDKPDNLLGVKMAAEITQHILTPDIDIPTRDFSVPDPQVFKQGLLRAVMLLSATDRPMYVGCMGGIGRTGLFFGGLAKVMSEYRGVKHRSKFDPVQYVRQHYHPDGNVPIETEQQEQYIADLDVADIVEWCCITQKILENGEVNPVLFKALEDYPEYDSAEEVVEIPDELGLLQDRVDELEVRMGDVEDKGRIISDLFGLIQKMVNEVYEMITTPRWRFWK